MKRSIMLICAVLMVLGISVLKPAQAQDAACAKAVTPHLKVGDQAQVIQPGAKNMPGAYLKPNPSHTGPLLRFLPVGTVVNVVDGPKCGDDLGYWFQVKYGTLTGWIEETVGKTYALEPAASATPSKPLDSTLLPAIRCIKSTAPNSETPSATQPLTGPQVLRVVYSTLDGKFQVSDNSVLGRLLNTFDPAPLSVDLSPDGSAALVTNYNGVYWVDLAFGKTLMIADAQTFNLPEGAWTSEALWLPSGRAAAVETTLVQANGIVGYQIWLLALDGTSAPTEMDEGDQQRGGLRKSPYTETLLLMSVHDISLFPKDPNDQTPALLEFVPKGSPSDATLFVIPALSWATDGKGFYTYIPLSELSGPDEKVGGHLWQVGLDGTNTDLGKIPKVPTTNYVIPSPSGAALLSGHGTSWAIIDAKTGAILQTLPPQSNVYDWTPDSKGVIYGDQDNAAKFMGVDGSTDSPYLPSGVTNLASISWLSDGTTLSVVQGKDGKLSFSVKPPNSDAKFLGIVSTINAISGRPLAGQPPAGVAPVSCG